MGKTAGKKIGGGKRKDEGTSPLGPAEGGGGGTNVALTMVVAVVAMVASFAATVGALGGGTGGGGDGACVEDGFSSCLADVTQVRGGFRRTALSAARHPRHDPTTLLHLSPLRVSGPRAPPRSGMRCGSPLLRRTRLRPAPRLRRGAKQRRRLHGDHLPQQPEREPRRPATLRPPAARPRERRRRQPGCLSHTAAAA